MYYMFRVALVMPHAKRVSRIILASVACPTMHNFFRIILRCYEGRTESHEQLFFFACELGTADEGE